MLRPSYNEQIHGFGFSSLDPLSGDRASTTARYSATIDTVLEAIPDIGSKHMFSDIAGFLNVGTSEHGGIGVLAPLSSDTRECYSYSMNGYLLAAHAAVFGFVGTLEETHVAGTEQPVIIRSFLPVKVYRDSVDKNSTVSCEGFCRPNINPSAYSNIANVTGLAFGIGIVIDTGSAGLSLLWNLSFEVQRWENPDVQIHTPVV